MSPPATVTISDLIESNQRDDIQSTAQAVAGALRLTKLQQAILSPLLAERVRLEWRRLTRNLEPRRLDREDADEADPVATRADYLAHRFAVGDGRYVLWGEATVEDHLARIDMLSKLRNGIDMTIAEHRDAIDRILAADVKCLNDLAVAA